MKLLMKSLITCSLPQQTGMLNYLRVQCGAVSLFKPSVKIFGCICHHSFFYKCFDMSLKSEECLWREIYWSYVKKQELMGNAVLQWINFFSTNSKNRVIKQVEPSKNQNPPYNAKNPYLAGVKVNRELHGPLSQRSCMHIEFDIEGSNMNYEAGDHLAVYPINSAENVEKIGKICSADLDVTCTLENINDYFDNDHFFSNSCTYRTVLTHYLDVSSYPESRILSHLAKYASDPNDSEKLKILSSSSQSGKEMYQNWILRDQRNILDVLEDLPSLKPPIDHLCKLLPKLRYRYYSISSSPKLHPTSIHITAVVIEYRTPTGRLRRGVTTSFLKQKHPCDPPSLVPIFVEKSHLRLPSDPKIPIVMIGPGTGLSPFRAFIQERDLAKHEGVETGETILFYGCRRRDEDFLYREELQEYVDRGSLIIHLAFSREQEENIYVTHLLERNADELWNVVEKKNGHVYICGGEKMSYDVRSVLLRIIGRKGSLDDSQALNYLKKMESENRYVTDVWS